ncbi:MAG: hypothetical protein RLZZ364_693 [Actinomycetota bacterium]
MKSVETFRARNSLVLAGIAYLMLTLFVVSEIINGSTSDVLIAISVATLIGQAAYLIFQRPALKLSDESLTIINPFKSFTIGWQDIENIEVRYALEIETTTGEKIHSWAATAPGRYHSRNIHPSETRGLGLEEIIRPGESPRVDSGVAAYLVRTRHREHRATAKALRIDRHNTTGLIAIAANALITLALIALHA